MALDESVLDSDTTTYLFLPLAHSFALLIQFLSFDLGGNIAYWERDPLKIIPNLAEVKPDVLPVGAAHLREDLHRRDGRGGEVGRPQEARLQLGDRRRQEGPPSGARRASRSAGCCASSTRSPTSRCSPRSARSSAAGSKNCVTGAAPINPEILRFFDAAGVLDPRGLGHDRDLDRRDGRQAGRLQVRQGRAARSPAARSRSPTTARSWSRARTSSRATTRTRRRPARRSRTAGCTPATSASSTRTATSRSPAARRTSSSPRAARTSRPRTSRPRSSRARTSPSAW